MAAKTTFSDLPKEIRERIYRMHLVSDEPLTITKHKRIAWHKERKRGYKDNSDEQGGLTTKDRRVPPLLAVSKKVEKETANIYYGENTFEFRETGSELTKFKSGTWPRHANLIKKVIHTFEGVSYVSADALRTLKRFKALQRLYIRVDEMALIGKRTDLEGVHTPTSQQRRLVIKVSGMSALLSLSVPYVEFIKKLDAKNKEYGGPISGGILETYVAPKIMSRMTIKTDQESPFSFLSLTPELRNHIYDIVFRMPGQLEPSTTTPAPLVPRYNNDRKNPPLTPPESALSLLLVSKQIYDEASGVFYNVNSFFFSHPVQFQAFVLSLNNGRLASIRDVTINYENQTVGNIDIAVMAFKLLGRLTGLRRVRIIMASPLERTRRSWVKMWPYDHPILRHPGIKNLFDLRGIMDIKIENEWLRNEIVAAKKQPGYPKLLAESEYGRVIRFKKLLKDLNVTLNNAQHGKLDRAALESTDHFTEHLPPMEEAIADLQKEENAENK